MSIQPGTPEWHARRSEEAIDPDRPIVDPHHHLWPVGDMFDYNVGHLVDDTTSGHAVIKTVFVECGAAYDAAAEPTRASVGETRFVAAAAAELAEQHPAAPPIAGMVASADLRADDLDELLDAHETAGGGLVRGIRHALASALEPDALMIPGGAPADLAQDPAFRAGVARLGARGLTYDTWHYHHQNRDFLDLARATPGTTMVLDHFGTPVGVGRFEGRHDEIFETWKDDITELATCENVVAKLGGLAMPDNGFGYHLRDTPATSDDLLADQRRWYEHTIESFGADRCMFESNFPVDKFSTSYTVVWNFFKKLTTQASDREKDALFAGTATRVYGL